MSIVITSTTDKKEYKSKSIINIGTNPKCDFVLKLPYDLLFSIQYNSENNIFQLTNNFKNSNILYKGDVLQKAFIEKGICRIAFKDSDEFVEIFVSDDCGMVVISEEDLKALYGEGALSEVKIKVEKAREPIEHARIALIKQISYPISELKSKIKANMRTSIILHIGLYFSSLLCSFALSNYLMGLTIQESARNLYLSTNIQIWIVYSFIVFGIGLMLKQGIYLSLCEKSISSSMPVSKIAKHFMMISSIIFVLGIYAVNLVYYGAISEYFEFALFISLFFLGVFAALSVACGYFKSNSLLYGVMLNKYEFREDFEAVIKAYRIWIERYINCLTSAKIDGIKDKLFSHQIWGGIEVLIGILTAPFLAYGVSNTLAMCFPEAANWVRISGLRFSPIFLILATFLIIFAFFSFVNAFVADKKLQASKVIKLDGFSDYRHHGVSIYGLEGAKKLEEDKKLFLIIGCSIVFIEFMMNVSYFMTEIGGEIQGIFLSVVSALVPTALLIAETMILAVTKFDIHNCEELISKLDKE